MKFRPLYMTTAQQPLAADIYGERAFDIISAMLLPGFGHCVPEHKRILDGSGVDSFVYSRPNLRIGSWNAIPCAAPDGRAAIAWRSIFPWDLQYADDMKETGVYMSRCSHHLPRITSGFKDNLVKCLNRFAAFLANVQGSWSTGRADKSREVSFIIKPAYDYDVNFRRCMRRIDVSIDDVVCLRKIVMNGANDKRTIKAHGEEKVRELAGERPNILEVTKQQVLQQTAGRLFESLVADSSKTVLDRAVEYAKFVLSNFNGVRQEAIVDEVIDMFPGATADGVSERLSKEVEA